MTILTQRLIGGLAVGSLYGLVALGLVLIHHTSGVVNFAQGEIGMVSTFVFFSLLTAARMPYWWAFPPALVFAALLGAAIERTAIRRARRTSMLGAIILTIGIMMVLGGMAGWVWGYEPWPFPSPTSGPPWSLGALVLSRHDVVSFLTAMTAATTFFCFLKYTLVGTGIRAVAQNPVAARLTGIPVDRIVAWSWAVAGVMAAVAGALVAPISHLSINMMGDMLLKGFTAAVLGGFESLGGALVGGLLLGMLENLAAGYISSEMKNTLAFLLIVVVLALRPQGLLGGRKMRRV